MSLPHGIVTFLLTDVEGYSRLCEDHGPAMSGIIRRHLTQLSGIVHSHGGSVFKTVGDGVLSAFTDAGNAVHAAIDIQRALLAPEALLGRQLSARIALHAGPAEAHDGDYVGRTMNRAARLLSAGHGGQILLSAAAAELVRTNVPGIALRDMGEHRLRDLQGDERIFQLVHTELSHEFPPLRTLDVQRSNLPSQLNSFFGRRVEMLALRAALEESRLVTLTGPGGVGKTRLALQSAARMTAQFPGGQWFIELAGLTDATPDQIVATIAGVLSIKDTSSAGTLEAAVNAIAAQAGVQRMLLILDNCEHVRTSTATLARALLERSPTMRVLATSRESLHVPGEQILPIGPLPLPDSADPTVLATSETAQLFLERARLASPSFRLNTHTAAAVAAIGRAVDGLPLGLELAAARLGGMDVRALAERLTQRVGHLGSLDPTAAPRHKTIDALIDWSYRLLSDAQRALLRRLSVLAATFSLEAAEEIAGDPADHTPASSSEALPRDTIAETLVSLVSASMAVHSDPDAHGGESRYRVLIPIQQFCRARAHEHPAEQTATALRLLDFAARLTERLSPSLNGPQQTATLKQFGLELDTIRVAAREAQRPEADPLVFARLVVACTPALYLRGLPAEGRAWADLALTRLAEAPSDLRGQLYNAAGMFAWRLGDRAIARERYQAALHEWRSRGDRRREAGALSNLALVNTDDRLLDSARDQLASALAIYRDELKDHGGAANAELNLGLVLGRLGNTADAHEAFLRCFHYFQTRDPHRAAVAEANLAEMCWRSADFPRAAHHIAHSLRVRFDAGDVRGVAARLPLAAAICTELNALSVAARLLGHTDRLLAATSQTIAEDEPDHPIRLRTKLASCMSEEDLSADLQAGMTCTDTSVMLTALEMVAHPPVHTARSRA